MTNAAPSNTRPLIGLATPNPDGTIGLGLQVVTVPGGRGLQIDARISPATLSGSWSDSAGNAGTFAFNANAAGTARPLPSATPIPTSFILQDDGGFLARAEGTGTIPVQGAGTRMMWHAGKAAFRAGQVSGAQWDDVNVGAGSTAFGINARASGLESTAMGDSTTASGTASTAMGTSTTAGGTASTALGSGTTASGSESTAMGQDTTASANNSTAMGFLTTASGDTSTALGSNTTASGSSSTAMGRDSAAGGNESLALGLGVTANGNGSVVLGSHAVARVVAPGTFMFGDRSTATDLVGSLPDQFLVRAAGGVVFHSNASLTAGVQLGPGGSQFLGFSDVRIKRDFRPLDGETVLAKLAGMPVHEWSYIAQDPAIRHVGPTAQDFHAAFGLGEDPLRIGTMDADGIALAGVRAVEARTREMRDAHEALQLRVAELERALAEALDAVRALKGGGR